MKLRDWMNNNSAIVTIAAVVILILSLGYIVWSSKGPSYGARVIDVYYYDLNTQKVFTAKSDQVPPIDAPSGPFRTPAGQEVPGGVRAYLFACGDCQDFTGLTAAELQAKGGFIGWLEMYTPEAKAMLTQPPGESPEAAAEREMRMYQVWESGQLIASPDNLRWVSQNTEEGVRITSQIEGKCPGGTPKPCLPGR